MELRGVEPRAFYAELRFGFFAIGPQFSGSILLRLAVGEVGFEQLHLVFRQLDAVHGAGDEIRSIMAQTPHSQSRALNGPSRAGGCASLHRYGVL